MLFIVLFIICRFALEKKQKKVMLLQPIQKNQTFTICSRHIIERKKWIYHPHNTTTMHNILESQIIKKQSQVTELKALQENLQKEFDRLSAERSS